MPAWFWNHHDADALRISPLQISTVPYYIRLQAREYHEGVREARWKEFARLAKRNKGGAMIVYEPEF